METLANFIPFKTPGFSRIMSVIKNHYLLIGILLLAAISRLYRIGDYMTFLGDEGRDMLVVMHILAGDLTLLGPRASAGDFFLGPFYYYFITPFLWLFNYNPVGPAVFVAIIGVLTVYLVYWLASTYFSRNAGLFAAALYAVSPVVVRYSMSSWNPNVVPFFTILLMIFLYKAVEQGSWKKLGIAGLLLGILMQLHYLATFIAVITAVFVFIGVILVSKKDTVIQKIKKYIVYYLSIFIGFLITFSPFIAFELRHGFPNIRTIFAFIFSPTLNSSGGERIPFFTIVLDVFYRIITRVFIFISENSNWSEWMVTLIYGVAIILALYSLYVLFKTKNKLFVLLMLVWLLVGILLFGFYKKSIYEYYFGFLFPVPFLLIGNALGYLSSNTLLKMNGKLIVIGLFILFMGVNISQLHVWHEPNRQKEQMRTIAEFVLSKTDNKPFNFALVTPGNSDHAYRYFFELQNRPPVTIENEVVDPERNTVTGQLLIVCEHSCSPLGHPLWEIAGFGNAQITGEWQVSVVKVYKLVPEKIEE